MSNNGESVAMKGGEPIFVQTLISASEHKDLKRIAVEMELTLSLTLREIIKTYIKTNKEKRNGKS